MDKSAVRTCPCGHVIDNFGYCLVSTPEGFHVHRIERQDGAEYQIAGIWLQGWWHELMCIDCGELVDV